MSDLPRFGDKSIGRDPLQRLVIWLKAHEYISPVLTVLALLLFIGINTIVHDASYAKGLSFLILISLILLKGRDKTNSFFGAPPLAIFIVLHISLFGFNVIPIIATFAVFNKTMEQHPLWPITAFLATDSGYLFLRLESYWNSLLNQLGPHIFSQDFFIVLLIIPIAYILYLLENLFKNKFGNTVLGRYGLCIALGVLMLISCLGFLITKSSLSTFLFTAVTMLYILNFISYKHNLKIVLLLYAPLLTVVTLIYLKNAGIL